MHSKTSSYVKCFLAVLSSPQKVAANSESFQFHPHLSYPLLFKRGCNLHFPIPVHYPDKQTSLAAILQDQSRNAVRTNLPVTIAVDK